MWEEREVEKKGVCLGEPGGGSRKWNGVVAMARVAAEAAVTVRATRSLALFPTIPSLSLSFLYSTQSHAQSPVSLCGGYSLGRYVGLKQRQGGGGVIPCRTLPCALSPSS